KKHGELLTSRAEGRAHGDFPAPGVDAYEKEIRDVGGGDQQDDGDRAEQDPQRTRHLVAYELVLKPRSANEKTPLVHSLVPKVRPQRFETLLDALDVRVHLLDGHA